jgi:hypothetical protein
MITVSTLAPITADAGNRPAAHVATVASRRG